MAKHTLRYGDGMAEMAAAACSTCVDSSADAAIPGPLGVKIDDTEYRVHVALAIPGVKKPGIFGTHKNTRVDAKFSDQSMRVLVEIEAGKSKKSKAAAGKYLYTVKKLPDRIVPDQCRFEIQKNQVIVHLLKAKIGSWQRVLDQQGLETAEEEDAQ